MKTPASELITALVLGVILGAFLMGIGLGLF